ncbi:TPA: hypothetical protein N0F65_007449 [Lagenidium giganteum]|uniref:Secreted protein n=1 Tax=Lagenidium giganteum TaxID=4803 RepID=A0AAV2ZFG6_9STRA|nr:TPA: hypothetical protein N0F65_007449 [Lagenidium giganteum]
MLQVIFLHAFIHVVDLVRAQQRAQPKDTGGQHLRRLRIEHALCVNEKDGDFFARLARADKRLFPHPDARRVALAARAPREALLAVRLLHIRVAFELHVALAVDTSLDPVLPGLIVSRRVLLEHASGWRVTANDLPVRKAPTTEMIATLMSVRTLWKIASSASSSSWNLVPSSLMLTILSTREREREHENRP